ncbi:MAG: hypothetical protein WCL29_05530 [Pseudomonadota bacterium]
METASASQSSVEDEPDQSLICSLGVTARNAAATLAATRATGL